VAVEIRTRAIRSGNRCFNPLDHGTISIHFGSLTILVTFAVHNIHSLILKSYKLIVVILVSFAVLLFSYLMINMANDSFNNILKR